MKQPTHKVVLSLLLLSSASGLLADAATASPYIAVRSQSANLALEMVGQEKYINRSGATENYSVFALTPGYQQSFRGGSLACCMFGPDISTSSDCAQINISGSGVDGRGACDWLADYFGLPTDFKSSIAFSPRISSIYVDANFYMGLDGWREGMYFRMHAPYVNTRWRLNPSEGSVTQGTGAYPFGYFSGDIANSGNPTSQLLTRALQFFSQGQTPSLTNNLTYMNAQGSSVSSNNAGSSFCGIAGTDLTSITYADNIVFEPLEYAQWSCGTLVKNGLADLRFALGYNAFNSDRFHLGLGLAGAAPTGNRPHGLYALEPIVGNGKHWELGAQITSHFKFWSSEDEERCFCGYLDANITHLFKARQRRTFDLVGKPNSRYMLAMELGQSNYLYNALMQKCITANYGPTSSASATIANSAAAISGIGGFDAVLTAGLTEASAQFQNHYAPVANLTTVDVNVTVGAQVDLALMLSYNHRNWSIDLGYNFWALTCERINLDCKDCPTRLADGKTWVLKGNAQVYGVNYGTSNIVLDTENFADTVLAGYNVGAGEGNPYALGVSQSNATIHGGATTANVSTVPALTTPYANNNVDSPRFAIAAIDVELAAINTADSVTVAQERSGVHTVYTPLYSTIGEVYGNPRVMNSLDPIYLTENDLDLEGARTKGLSNKVFAHFSYEWKRDECTPFLGVGASGEFLNAPSCCGTSCTSSASTSASSSITTNGCCKTSCKTSCKSSCSEGGCKRCGLSQWNVWVKGGVSFN